MLAGLAAAAVTFPFPKLAASPAAETANRLAGERWYAMMYRHRPVGHYHASTGRTFRRHFEFRTDLRFALANGVETRMSDTLVFHRRPPHRLLRAEHKSFSGQVQQRRVTITGGVATVREGPDTVRVDTDDDLLLTDYLAIERWLADDEHSVGATRSARAIDFDRLAVVTDRWRILDRDADGVTVGKDAQAGSTFVRMNRELVPERMQIGPLFTLQAVDHEGVARLWERQPAVFDDAQDVVVDKRIDRPAALTRLVLTIHHESDVVPPWMATLPATLSADGRLGRTAEPDDMARGTVATVRHPADDPRILDLAARAVAGLVDDGERATALTAFVHGHLSYRDSPDAPSVLATMRSRVGDCTEFADFYTTLARAVGLPARTVVGLAYREAPGDAAGTFALHAWNEVAVDGFWRSVDPTWGQASADLTHFALPDDSALTLIAERSDLRLEVVEAVY